MGLRYLLPFLLIMLVQPLLQVNAQPEKVEEAFIILESLSREGMNVSEPIHLLNSALALYRENKTEEAEKLLKQALERLRELENELPSYKFWRDLKLYSSIVVMALIPIAFYYFFPRVYAFSWYKTRRKWVVRRKRGRGKKK